MKIKLKKMKWMIGVLVTILKYFFQKSNIKMKKMF